MKQFEILEEAGNKTFWIYPDMEGEFEPVVGEPDKDRAAIRIRYLSPRDQERLQKRLISEGILKRKFHRGGGETVDVCPGREADRDMAYGKAFIADWQNISIGEQSPTPFSPEAAGMAIQRSIIFNKCVGRAVDEAERFLARLAGTSSDA